MSIPFKGFGFLLGKLFDRGRGKLPGIEAIYRRLYSVFIKEQIIEVETIGFKLLISTRDMAMAPILNSTHTWEPLETEIVKTLVKPGMVFVDIGAHIGYYTTIASKLVGLQGRVYAFEPHPQTFKLLSKNVDGNRLENVVLFSKAVGNQTKKVMLYQSGSPSNSSLLKFGKALEIFGVDIVKLDDILLGSQVDFVKIDVEGGELGVLKGMEGIIRWNSYLQILVEVFPSRLRLGGISLSEFLDWLLQYFELSLITRTKLVPYKDISQFDSIKKRSSINLLGSRRR